MVGTLALVLTVPWSLLFLKVSFIFRLASLLMKDGHHRVHSLIASHPYKTKTWPKVRPSPVSVPGRKEKDFTDRFKPVRVHACT